MSAAAPRRHRIAITGASGFIGRGMVRRFTAAGHTVIRIGRGNDSDVRWDPATGIIDAAALEGSDVVIGLAGENIAQRWTPRVKRALRESRILGTRLLARTIAGLRTKPAVLLAASGIGIYGNRGDAWVDESTPAGDDFLATLGRDWEAAADPARDAGIRVVHFRTGVVLDPDGGALGKMLLPFKLGLGGPFGDGRQWWGWLSREDLERIYEFAIDSPTLSGPVNAVAPEAVTNATFVATLGRVLRRPAIMPVPAFALQLAFGEMARGALLGSQRARPSALEAAGFRFTHPTLASALRAELGIA
jgi:uncharacterized protein (TIGR01777 family)